MHATASGQSIATTGVGSETQVAVAFECVASGPRRLRRARASPSGYEAGRQPVLLPKKQSKRSDEVSMRYGLGTPKSSKKAQALGRRTELMVQWQDGHGAGALRHCKVHWSWQDSESLTSELASSAYTAPGRIGHHGIGWIAKASSGCV